MDDREKLQRVLREAVSVIYFDDSSDYGSALWSIVRIIGGSDLCDLLDANPSEAYKKYVDGK